MIPSSEHMDRVYPERVAARNVMPEPMPCPFCGVPPCLIRETLRVRCCTDGCPTSHQGIRLLKWNDQRGMQAAVKEVADVAEAEMAKVVAECETTVKDVMAGHQAAVENAVLENEKVARITERTHCNIEKAEAVVAGRERCEQAVTTELGNWCPHASDEIHRFAATVIAAIRAGKCEACGGKGCGMGSDEEGKAVSRVCHHCHGTGKAGEK